MDLFFAHQFPLVFVYLMCGPRQLSLFRCGPETPKGWTPLLRILIVMVVCNCKNLSSPILKWMEFIVLNYSSMNLMRKKKLQLKHINQTFDDMHLGVNGKVMQ